MLNAKGGCIGRPMSTLPGLVGEVLVDLMRLRNLFDELGRAPTLLEARQFAKRAEGELSDLISDVLVIAEHIRPRGPPPGSVSAIQ
jgi:hypothetical protein